MVQLYDKPEGKGGMELEALKKEGPFIAEVKTDKLDDVVDVVVVEVPGQLEPASLDGGGTEAD